MRVKCIKAFYDLERKSAVAVGDQFEVSKARGEALTSVNNKAGYVLCEVIPTPTTEKVATAAAKTRKKAVTNE